jgi:adenylate kinase family enzyme
LILLYGRPASGKSRLARDIAKRTGLRIITVDEMRARTKTADAAQAQLIYQVKRSTDELIVEACCPHPRLVELSRLTVQVRTSDELVQTRLLKRGWTKAHVSRALRERYAVRPDVTVDSVSTTATDDVIAALERL